MLKRSIFMALAFAMSSAIAQKTATTVWNHLDVWAEPSKAAKDMGDLYFGETVTLTDERQEVEEDRKRTYTKIILPNGKTGWINEYLLVPDGEAVVINAPVAAIKNPKDPKTFLVGVEFSPGEPVVKTEYSGEYVYVVGQEKKKKGWVPIENLYMGQEEVRAALLLQKAMRESDEAKSAKMIDKLYHSPEVAYLKIKPIIDIAYLATIAGSSNTTSEVASNTNAPTTSTNTRGWPPKNTQPKVAIKQKNLSKETERKSLNVNGKSFIQYTENLTLMEVVDQKEDNSLKCYHHYLPIGTKVVLVLPNQEGLIELEVAGNLEPENALGLTNGAIQRIFGDDPSDTVEIYFYSKTK